jgi:hypothetical protein
MKYSTNAGLLNEAVSGNLKKGTYYIKVLSAGTTATEYDLNLNLTPPSFSSGSLRLFGASSPLPGGSDTALANDPLKKSQGMLAS